MAELDIPLPFLEGSLGRQVSPPLDGRVAAMPRTPLPEGERKAVGTGDPDLPGRSDFRGDLFFSSRKSDWTTPPSLLIPLMQEFPIGIDLAATAENSVTPAYLGPASPLGEDALLVEWAELGVEWGWLNPPYSRGVGVWVGKALDAASKGMGVIMLLPARTDTGWFHEFCLKGEVRFLRGRLRFGGATAGAPFPSMIVVFRPRYGEQKWARMGAVHV